MALDVEGVADGGMGRQEALRRSGRLEPLHLAFTPPSRLMRVLGQIVPTLALFVPCRKPKLPDGSTVGSALSR